MCMGVWEDPKSSSRVQNQPEWLQWTQTRLQHGARKPKLFLRDVLKGARLEAAQRGRVKGAGPPQQVTPGASTGMDMEWRGSGTAVRMMRSPEEAAKDWERG